MGWLKKYYMITLVAMRRDKMKILIALDLGKIKPGTNPIIVGYYDENKIHKELTYEELLVLKHGEIISFDNAYLEYDREDDSFYEAEFHGILEE